MCRTARAWARSKRRWMSSRRRASAGRSRWSTSTTGRPACRRSSSALISCGITGSSGRKAGTRGAASLPRISENAHASVHFSARLGRQRAHAVAMPKFLPVVALLSIVAAAATAVDRPNVLVILTDDMRWDAMGVVQREEGRDALYPWFKTPNIDRLAAEGTRFANMFVTTSLCSPSRASMISGQYAHRHKVLTNFVEYPRELPGYPRRLQEAGYETAYIGKWHMGEENDEQRPGFDFWMSHKGQGSYWDTEFNVNGERRVLKGYYTHVVTGAALDWLRRPHAKPWLLVLG